MRLAGILIIGFCVAGYGFFSTYKLVTKSKQLEQIISMINSYEQRIKYSKDTLPQIFNSFYKKSEFSFLFYKEFLCPEKYFSNTCFDNSMLLLSQEQKSSLYSFFNELGKTDLQSQINHCENYKSVFTEYFKKTKEENKSKIKLYPSLYTLLGMFTVLILL